MNSGRLQEEIIQTKTKTAVCLPLSNNAPAAGIDSMSYSTSADIRARRFC